MAFSMQRVKTDTSGRLEALARAGDPSTDVTELVQLAAHRDPYVRATVAGRRDCPMAALISLAQEDDARVAEVAAGNPMLPIAVLEALLDHSRGPVRNVARHRLGLRPR